MEGGGRESGRRGGRGVGAVEALSSRWASPARWFDGDRARGRSNRKATGGAWEAGLASWSGPDGSGRLAIWAKAQRGGGASFHLKIKIERGKDLFEHPKDLGKIWDLAH